LFWVDDAKIAIFDQNKAFSYIYISTTTSPIDMIQISVYLG
jgi:hypothetical protein